MSRPSEVLGRRLRLTVPYDGLPAGTEVDVRSVEFDVFTSTVRSMRVVPVGGDPTRDERAWHKPGCLAEDLGDTPR